MSGSLLRLAKGSTAIDGLRDDTDAGTWLLFDCAIRVSAAIDRRRRPDRFAGAFLNCANEAKAAAVDRLDQRLPVAIVADRLPRGVDPAAQRGLRHDPSVPDGVQQLVLAHDTVAVAYQVHQQVVHLRLHMNDLTGTPQLLTTQVDLMVTEDKTHARLLLSTSRSIIELQHKSLNRSADVLQVECPKLLERKIRPLAHLITHCTRDTNTPRRTLGLKSNSYIDAVTMQVGSVRNRVADIDANAKANRSARRLIGIMQRHLLLHFYSATDRAVDAVEHDQQ